MKVRNYELSNDGVLLYISHNGNQYYTEYTPEIEALLSNNSLGTFSTNGKRGGNYPKFDLGPPRRVFAPYLHHIVFCFHHRNLTEQNYMEVLRQFSTELNNSNCCIDHLHSGVENCCISNLHLMDNGKHRIKTMEESRKITRIRKIEKGGHIFHIVKANDGNCIRVQIAYISSFFKREIRFLRTYTTNDDAFIDLLIHINAGSIWQMVNERKGIVCNDDSYTLSGGFLCCPKVIPQKSIYALQHDLLKMELSEFFRWEVIDTK